MYMDNNNAKNKLLSVFMITYNHENYIRQALDGILMQQTDFEFDVVVGEDASTDNTRKILLDYQKKYPDKLRLLLHDKNIGAIANQHTVFVQCKGSKYIAMCEGDDYWTDLLKLQKQVDFLEANPQYDICSHRFKILDDENKTWKDPIPLPVMRDDEKGVEFDFKSLLSVWAAQTMTLVFRAEKLFAAGIEKYEKFCDFHLCYLLVKEKKGYCMNMDSAVYRLNAGSVFGKQMLERKTYMGYYTTRDLFLHNQNDPVLARNYYLNREAFFDNYLRLSVYNRKFSKLWFKELCVYTTEEFKLKGWRALIFIGKKIVLSFVKSFKSKK